MTPVSAGVFIGGNMSKYTKSAKGQGCQIRIPGVCNYNPDTTVFCHINGAGMGYKFPDIIGSYGCSSCHDVIDGRVDIGLTRADRDAYMMAGLVRTQIIMIENGVLVL